MPACLPARSPSMVAWLVLCAAQEPRPGLELDLAAFDHVWTAVRDRFHDPSVAGPTWDALRGELRPRVERSASRAETRGILRELLAQLGSSHCDVFSPEAYEESQSAVAEGGRDGTLGLDLRWIDGRAILTRVAAGSAAEERGIRP